MIPLSPCFAGGDAEGRGGFREVCDRWSPPLQSLHDSFPQRGEARGR